MKLPPLLRAALPLTAVLCLLSSPARADGLGDALDHILSIPALKGGITGAVVQRVGDGQILYAREADRRLMPASNRKLFTSAAALEVLGDGFTFTTEALATAKPDAGGMLHGDICLRGVGDSLLSPDDMDQMAKEVAGAGVKRIEGRVIGDGGVFRDGPYGDGWSWDDLPYYYAAQVAGLEVSRGVLAVHVTAGTAIGDPVRVAVDQPTAYLPLVNTATTGDKSAANDCDISRPSGHNLLVVTGTVPARRQGGRSGHRRRPRPLRRHRFQGGIGTPGRGCDRPGTERGAARHGDGPARLAHERSLICLYRPDEQAQR